jgi:Mn-dependent DtxR family transcriptional regulator
MQAQIDLGWVIQIIRHHPNIAIEEIARKMRCSTGTATKAVGELIGRGTVLCKVDLLGELKRLTYKLA